MHTNKHEIIIDESLLIQYIRGKASIQETEKINQWVEESEENRKIFQNITLIYHASEVIHTMKTANPEKSLKHVRNKIRKNRNKRIFIRIQKFAALVAIPLLFTSLYFFRQYNDYKTVLDSEQHIEINSSPGAVMSFVLPDGTKVWLNSNSYIKYPVRFLNGNREVTIRGEAYFSVKKDKNKPFIVSVNNDYKIKVLGTEFNIEAYDNQSAINTTLVNGSVELVASGNEKQVIDHLIPGEQLILDKQTHTITKKKINPAPFIAWKEGKIILKDNPMSDVIDILSKRYNVKFIIQNQMLREHRFTGTFTNQQLVQILEHFKISSGIRYEIKGHELNPDGTIRETTVILK